jgi:hypothetical protein
VGDGYHPPHSALIYRFLSLPKVFSCSPLTLALSREGRGEFKERTFGNRYSTSFVIIPHHHPQRLCLMKDRNPEEACRLENVVFGENGSRKGKRVTA